MVEQVVNSANVTSGAQSLVQGAVASGSSKIVEGVDPNVTTVGSTAELQKEHPKFHKLVMLGLAQQACHQSQRATERLKKMNRESRQG